MALKSPTSKKGRHSGLQRLETAMPNRAAAGEQAYPRLKRGLIWLPAPPAGWPRSQPAASTPQHPARPDTCTAGASAQATRWESSIQTLTNPYINTAPLIAPPRLQVERVLKVHLNCGQLRAKGRPPLGEQACTGLFQHVANHSLTSRQKHWLVRSNGRGPRTGTCGACGRRARGAWARGL